jgi:hypothetical protein
MNIHVKHSLETWPEIDNNLKRKGQGVNLFTTQAKENTLVENIISTAFRKTSVPRHKPYPNMYLDKEAACWT